MSTQSLDTITRYETSDDHALNFSSPELSEWRPAQAARDYAAARLLEFLLASSLITGPANYVDPQHFLRFSSSSIFSPFRQRRGRRVSASEARQIALQILADAKRELHQERASEAQFLISIWDDELPEAE